MKRTTRSKFTKKLNPTEQHYLDFYSQFFGKMDAYERDSEGNLYAYTRCPFPSISKKPHSLLLALSDGNWFCGACKEYGATTCWSDLAQRLAMTKRDVLRTYESEKDDAFFDPIKRKGEIYAKS